MTPIKAGWGPGVDAGWGPGVTAGWGEAETRRKGRIETTVDYDIAGDEEAVVVAVMVVIGGSCPQD